MNRRSTLSFILLGCILAAAICVQLYRSSEMGDTVKHPPLKTSLPLELTGWQSRDLPLAETEETKNTVEGILQFDDYFSRSYRSGSTEVTVYVAYWQRDKVPPRLVGRHTPDRCWILNGWQCTARVRKVAFTGTRGPLQPAELGTYVFRDRAKLYVVFWHLVGGEVYAYGPEQSDMVAFAPLTDLRTFGLNQREEQYFIRIASTEPLDRIWHERGFRELLAGLEKLGLNRLH